MTAKNVKVFSVVLNPPVWWWFLDELAVDII